MEENNTIEETKEPLGESTAYYAHCYVSGCEYAKVQDIR